MVKNTVTPLTISLLAVTFSARRPKSFSSIASSRMRKGRKRWLPAFQISPRTWPFFAVTFFYGCFDKVLRGNCHEIFGDIAMQHAQFYFGKSGTKRRLAYALLLGQAVPVPDSLTVPLHADSRRAVAANRPQLSNTPYINLDGQKGAHAHRVA